MNHKKDQEFEQTLAESELLLRGAARSASDDADLTLESILAEFGSREDGAEAADAGFRDAEDESRQRQDGSDGGEQIDRHTATLVPQ